MSANTQQAQRDQLLAYVCQCRTIPKELYSKISDMIENDLKLIKSLKMSETELSGYLNKQIELYQKLYTEAEMYKSLAYYKEKELDQVKKLMQKNTITLQDELSKLQLQKIYLTTQLSSEKQNAYKLAEQNSTLYKYIDQSYSEYEYKVSNLNKVIQMHETNIQRYKEQCSYVDKDCNAKIASLQRSAQKEQALFQSRIDTLQRYNTECHGYVAQYKQYINEYNKLYQSEKQHNDEFRAYATEKIDEYQEEIQRLGIKLSNVSYLQRQQQYELEYEKRRNQTLCADTEKYMIIRQLQAEIRQMQVDSLQQKEIASSLLDQRNAQEQMAKTLQKDLDELRSKCQNSANMYKIEAQDKLVKEQQQKIAELYRMLDFHASNASGRSASKPTSSASCRLSYSTSEGSRLRRAVASRLSRSRDSNKSHLIASYLGDHATGLRRNSQQGEKQTMKSLAVLETDVRLIQEKYKSRPGGGEDIAIENLDDEIRLSQQLLARNQELERELNRVRHEAARSKKELNMVRIGVVY